MPDAPALRERPPAEPLGGVTVLLVEGEDTLRTLCGACSHGSHRFFVARTAEEAFRVLETEPVDVVLAEQDVPRCDGAAVLKRARVLRPGAVRILCCRSLTPETVEDALWGAEAFRLLPEPLEREQLCGVVQEALRFRSLAGTVPPSPEDAQARVKGLLDALLPSLPAGVVELDAAGRVTGVNAAAQVLLGTREEGLVGRKALEVGVPCRHEECACGTADKPLCSSRDMGTIRCWGQERSVLWSCEAAEAGRGAAGGCTATFMDIGDCRPFEAKIIQAKHEIEATFDSITDPTFLVDSQLRVLRANRALTLYAGKPFRELLGRRCSEVLDLSGKGCGACRLPELFASGQSAQDEVRRPGGRICQIHYFPIVRRGKCERVVVRYQDITAQRELEERLLQSEKMASVGQLSAGIAHEINNPMAFIFSNLDHLADYTARASSVLRQTRALAAAALTGAAAPLDAWRDCQAACEEAELEYVLEDTAALVDECREGAERIRKIIADLKAFSHPAEASWAEADLHEGIESTLNIVWNELKHRCEVVRDYGVLPRVRCRPQLLNQVFMNLLVNAAQAMAERGVVTVRTRAEGDRVSVAVSDTGVGVPPENVKRIFDPFFTTKPAGKGTGLGLHLALGVVRQHGGEIQVDTEPGRGSTFTVLLPLSGNRAPLSGD